jgi:hypothetical protein
MTTPRNDFLHSEYPLAADLNDFSTAEDEIYAVLGDVALNYAVPAEVSSGEFTLFHKYRWLFFRSVGVIVDPSGVGDDVSISEADSGTSKYDLDSVSWLVYGARYVVTGVSFCGESEA